MFPKPESSEKPNQQNIYLQTIMESYRKPISPEKERVPGWSLVTKLKDKLINNLKNKKSKQGNYFHR